jgi:hypothetical protein
MKTNKWMWLLPLALLIFLTASASAHADLYWESEVMTSGVPAGLEGLPPQARSELLEEFKPKTKTVKYYLTSNASRTDISNDIIMITEFDTMTMYQLNVNDKTYTKTDMLSEMDQEMPKEMMEIRVTPTSETKKIAGYQCKKYTVTMMRENSEEKSNVVENECNGDGEPIGGISRQNGDECNGHNDYKYSKED